jgi:Fe-S-cluster containining protein
VPVAQPERERRAKTLAILKDADQLLEGWSCDSSTDCCRFAVTGREPWLTEAEFVLLAAEVARQGRKLPAVRDDEVCPMLSAEGRCTVYEVRPLGCRTFFCDRAQGYGSYPRRDVSRLPRRLDELSTSPSRPIRSWLAKR